MILARMRHGRIRRLAFVGYYTLLGAVAADVFGLSATGLVLLHAQVTVRRTLSATHFNLFIDESRLKTLWCFPFAVVWQVEGSRVQWLCRDEVDAATFAEVRRRLLTA